MIILFKSIARRKCEIDRCRVGIERSEKGGRRRKQIEVDYFVKWQSHGWHCVMFTFIESTEPRPTWFLFTI